MSRPTKTAIGRKAREIIMQGARAIYIPVGMSLGPQGKNALLYRTFNRGSRITNDGYTIGEVQEPKDILIRLAATAFKESCKRTNEKAGDGTTTTVVIAGRLLEDADRLVSEGSSDLTSKTLGKKGVMTVRKSILESAEKVKARIREVACPIKDLEDLERIATVSVEDAKLGKIIAKVAWDVGQDGFVDVIEGYKGEIETEVIKGMKFPAKIPAKAFVNNPARYEMIAQDCPVLVTNYAMDNAGDVQKVFRALNDSGVSKLIVISPSFSENMLVNMVNTSKQGYFFYPVHVPSLRQEQFDDLATYCGANFIDKNKGKKLKNVTIEDLGFLEKLVVKDTESKEDAVATGGKGAKEMVGMDGSQVLTAVQQRINLLKGQLEETKEHQFKLLLERRIASMASSVGIIRVGDATQASSAYYKLKIEDAVYAAKAALRSGYVKGGGLCLKEIANELQDDDILKKALCTPYEQIQASIDGGIEITDDIIDPADVVYYAVEHASQVAANLITVEIITNEMEDAMPEEGGFATANAITELTLTQKRQLGQIKENEEEMERDRLKGLTIDETIYLDGENLL